MLKRFIVLLSKMKCINVCYLPKQLWLFNLCNEQVLRTYVHERKLSTWAHKIVFTIGLQVIVRTAVYIMFYFGYIINQLKKSCLSVCNIFTGKNKSGISVKKQTLCRIHFSNMNKDNTWRSEKYTNIMTSCQENVLVRYLR